MNLFGPRESRMDETGGTTDNDGTFLKGLFFGAIVGAVLTALFTTEKGKDVRRALTGKGLVLLDDLESLLHSVEDGADDLDIKAEEVKAEVERELGESPAAERIEHMVTEIQEQGRAMVKRVASHPIKPRRFTFTKRSAAHR